MPAVGNIVWLVPKGKFTIIPALVVEEVIKKGMNGQQVIYNVKLENDEKPIDLSTLKVDCYESLDKAASSMRKAIEEKISSMCKVASDSAEKVFGPVKPQPLHEGIERVDGIVQQQAQVVSRTGPRVLLPDGTYLTADDV